DRTNIQFAADCLRIDLSSLVTECRCSGHNAQLSQVGKAVDQRLGYSIRKVLGAGIAAGVCKRHDRYRIDLATIVSEVSIRKYSSDDDEHTESAEVQSTYDRFSPRPEAPRTGAVGFDYGLLLLPPLWKQFGL